MKPLHNLFGILLQGKFVPSLPFVYLFNHLLILIRTQGYLFSASGYNLILFYLFCVQIVPDLALGSSLKSVPVSLPHAPLIVGFSVCVSTSLLSGTTRCSRFFLYISCSSPGVSYFSEELSHPLYERKPKGSWGQMEIMIGGKQARSSD